MSRTTAQNGRLGNQIIRNIAVSIIAAKHNLHVTYSSYDKISSLGIKLACGSNKYDEIADLDEKNYFYILGLSEFPYNVYSDKSYFQTADIVSIILKELRAQQANIEAANPVKHRYGKNNDCFIHVRLGDVARHNPSLKYYAEALSKITFDNLYISTDSPEDPLIRKLAELYPEKVALLLVDEISTIQFGSTCKYIILSHGSYSALIGYLAFYSQVYYPSCEGVDPWFSKDLFSIPEWSVIPHKN